MGSRTDVLLGVVPYRTKPIAIADGSVAGMYARGGRYGEQMGLSLVPTKHLLADEGSYFTAQNPTIGTGVVTNAAVTAFSDTVGTWVLRNNNTVGSGIRVYLDYLKLIVTSATTAVASVDFVVKLDTIVRSPSTASTGTAATAVNVNMDDNTQSNLIVIGYNASGTMTIPASSAMARNVARVHAATGLHFAGDEIIAQFGATERSSGGAPLTAVRAVGAAKLVADGAPVIIGPQQTAVITRWSLTEAATISYEWELGWWER